MSKADELMEAMWATGATPQRVAATICETLGITREGVDATAGILGFSVLNEQELSAARIAADALAALLEVAGR